jgi:hypothetical protein
MQWQEIRERYPERWLLLEALEAHTEAGQRILDRLAVVDAFDDWKTAFDNYRNLHRQAPLREFYVLHADREQPDIRELHWLGMRTHA